MPELPEVESIVRTLRPVILGAEMNELQVLDRKLKALAKLAHGRYGVVSVERLGKQIVIALQNSKKSKLRYVVIHLRMSGRLLWLSKSSTSTMKKHRRFSWKGKQGELVLIDPRRFATADVVDDLIRHLPTGIDPTSKQFTKTVFRSLLKQSRQPIKPWLIRQDKLVGIGNIYASEILFLARIHPERLAGSLSDKEENCLYRRVKEVLFDAIKRGGTTVSDFQHPTGDVGGYQDYLFVYERESLPCSVCSTPIQRTIQVGRSTYFCPECQSSLENGSS